MWPSLAKLLEMSENSRLEALHDHPGVAHNYPIYIDALFVAELLKLFPVNCVPLSVMTEFSTSKHWIMLVTNFTTCSEVILMIGHALIHLVNLSIMTRTCV